MQRKSVASVWTKEAQWDGLLTKMDEHMLVLAATNRPFDLDEANIRHFEQRYVIF